MIFIKMLSSINKNSRKSKREKLQLKLDEIKVNFIPTAKVKERLQKIKNYFDSEK